MYRLYRHSLPVPTKPHLLPLHRSPLLQKLPLLQRQFLGHHQKLRKFQSSIFSSFTDYSVFSCSSFADFSPFCSSCSTVFLLCLRVVRPPPPRMPAQKPCLPLRSAQVPSHNNFSSYFFLPFICTFFIPNANKFLFSSQTEKSTAHIRQCSFFAAGCQLKGPVALRHRLFAYFAELCLFSAEFIILCNLNYGKKGFLLQP